MLKKSRIILTLLLFIPALLYSQHDSILNKLNRLEANDKINLLDSVLSSSNINPQKVLEYVKEKVKIIESSGFDDSIKASSYYDLGKAYMPLFLYDSSISSFYTALKIYKDLNNKKQTAIIYSNLGSAFNNKGDYGKAYEYYIKELVIFEGLKDSAGLAAAYNHLGSVMISLGRYNNALEYCLKAAALSEQLRIINLLPKVYNSIGVVYDYLHNLDKALEYHKKALEIRIKNNDEIGIIYSKINIAEVLIEEENYTQALTYFTEVLEYSKAKNLKTPLIYALRGIGNINFCNGDYGKSVYYLNEAISVAKEINSNFELRDCYNALSETYEKMDDHVNALKYYKIFTMYKDSVINTENMAKVNELQTQYETSKKEKENELLKAELAYKNEIQIYYIIILVMGSVFVILSIFWIRKISRANRQLKELNGTKDKFFTIIAHDLKNPFSTLMGFSKMLEEDFKENSDEENIASLQALYESSRSGFKLLENLLDWSKSQTGALKFNPIKLDLHEITDGIIMLLNQTARSKNIKLESRIGENVFIKADKEMISATIRNIVSNALKFTNEGGNVEIVVENTNGDVEIRVKDNGIGIKKEDLDKLFKLDAHHTTPGTNAEKGTGLGLIICKEFVEKNGGTIKIISSPGNGTEFKIKLPRALENVY